MFATEESLVRFLIAVVVIGLFAGLACWVVTAATFIPAELKNFLRIVIIAVCCIVILLMLLRLV